MNIVLIGYRGTGKTTVAHLLARTLNRPVISTDEEITRRAGLPIPDIVSRFGWDYFRDLESTVIKEIATKDNLIIDCGGGVIIREINTQLLREKGIMVLLLANRDTIVQRISQGKDRPSLTGTKSFIDEIEEVLAERMPKYLAAADISIDTTQLSPSEVTRQILKELASRKFISQIPTL